MEGEGGTVRWGSCGGRGGRMEIAGVALGGRGEQVLTGIAAEVVPIVVGTCAWRNLQEG